MANENDMTGDGDESDSSIEYLKTIPASKSNNTPQLERPTGVAGEVKRSSNHSLLRMKEEASPMSRIVRSPMTSKRQRQGTLVPHQRHPKTPLSQPTRNSNSNSNSNNISSRSKRKSPAKSSRNGVASSANSENESRQQPQHEQSLNRNRGVSSANRQATEGLHAAARSPFSPSEVSSSTAVRSPFALSETSSSSFNKGEKKRKQPQQQQQQPQPQPQPQPQHANQSLTLQKKQTAADKNVQPIRPMSDKKRERQEVIDLLDDSSDDSEQSTDGKDPGSDSSQIAVQIEKSTAVRKPASALVQSPVRPDAEERRKQRSLEALKMRHVASSPPRNRSRQTELQYYKSPLRRAEDMDKKPPPKATGRMLFDNHVAEEINVAGNSSSQSDDDSIEFLYVQKVPVDSSVAHRSQQKEGSTEVAVKAESEVIVNKEEQGIQTQEVTKQDSSVSDPNEQRAKRVFSGIVYGESANERSGFWKSELDSDDNVTYDSDAEDNEDLGDDSSYGSDREKSKEFNVLKYMKKFDHLKGSRTDPIKKKIKTRDLGNIQADLPSPLCAVDHMTTFELDKHGRPCSTFVLLSPDEDALYRFRLDVRESTIPGAGLGAFLTYLGSLHHNQPDVHDKYQRVLSSRPCFFPRTTHALDFIASDGRPASLKLTGQNLHGNNNNPYWNRKHVPSAVDEDLPEIQSSEDSEYLELKNRVGEEEKPFGFLELLKESDFSPSNAIFDIQTKSIEIGRYGPHRKEDRKPESLFICKNFLFQTQPSIYSFEVAENHYLNGEIQIIDISDDVTGFPHDDARRTLPMYINEVGPSLDRKQNVFILSDEFERSIQYSFVLPNEEALQAGSSFELFTNYFDAYETHRERHGYGLKNLYRHKKSDAECYASYLERNIRLRDDVLNIADSVDLQKIQIMEYIRDYTYEPIMKLLSSFITTGDCAVLSSWQLLCIRRIFWLKERFETGVDRWEEILQREPARPAYWFIDQCRHVMEEIYCPEYITKLAFKDERQLSDPLGGHRPISKLMEDEAVEEACFALRKRLVKPFAASIWCPVACDLIKKLSKLVAHHLWPVEQSVCSDSVRACQEELLNALVAAGKDAVTRMKEAVAENGDLRDLSFASGFKETMVLQDGVVEQLSVLEEEVFLQHAVTPKGFLAAAFERLAFMDCLLVCSEQPVGRNQQDRHIDHNRRFLMTSCSQFVNVNKDLKDLASLPRDAAMIGPFRNEINLGWDVVERLCTEYEVPIEAARFALSNGIGNSKQYHKFCTPQVRFCCQKVLDLPGSIAVSTAHRFNISHRSHGEGKRTLDRKKAHKSRRKGERTLLPSSSVPRIPVPKVWEGPPDEPIDGGWPAGWVKKVYERQTGESKGHRDRYWYSPQNAFKLRSMKEVQRFMALLEMHQGDEEAVIAAFKGKRK